jgi:hypothetical protein
MIESIFETNIKFPKTFHFPFSPGLTKGDKKLENTDQFLNKEVVILEKVDGENTTITRSKCYARSVDSQHHWSRSRIKAMQSELSIKLQDPKFDEILRITGENLVAKHTIFYNELPDWFLCFGIWDHQGDCVSWDDMVILAEELGITLVPLLARGIYQKNDKILLPDGKLLDVKSFFTGKSKIGGDQEGFVVRLASSFNHKDYKTSTAKYVRKNHVQTDKHWLKFSDIPNELKK